MTIRGKVIPALAYRFSGATPAEPRTETSTVLVDELDADGLTALVVPVEKPFTASGRA
jgi:hypothetical protein